MPAACQELNRVFLQPHEKRDKRANSSLIIKIVVLKLLLLIIFIKEIHVIIVKGIYGHET